MSSNEKLTNILVLIGGILGVIQGIGSIFDIASYYQNPAIRIIFGILGILLGLGLIVSSGYLQMELPFKIPLEGIPLLISGIVLIVFSAYIGGILIIIAAILLLV